MCTMWGQACPSLRFPRGWDPITSVLQTPLEVCLDLTKEAHQLGTPHCIHALAQPPLQGFNVS